MWHLKWTVAVTVKACQHSYKADLSDNLKNYTSDHLKASSREIDKYCLTLWQIKHPVIIKRRTGTCWLLGNHGCRQMNRPTHFGQRYLVVQVTIYCQHGKVLEKGAEPATLKTEGIYTDTTLRNAGSPKSVFSTKSVECMIHHCHLWKGENRYSLK